MGVKTRLFIQYEGLSCFECASSCLLSQSPSSWLNSWSIYDQQYQYILQLQDHLNQQVQWNGRRKRSLPVPGTTGLVPGSAAEAQWYRQNLAQIALNNGRKKRSLPVPGTIPGLVPGSAAEAQWYQAQLAAIAGRKKRSLPVPGTTGLVPGSAAEAQWYQQNLAQIALNNG